MGGSSRAAADICHSACSVQSSEPSSPRRRWPEQQKECSIGLVQLRQKPLSSRSIRSSVVSVVHRATSRGIGVLYRSIWQDLFKLLDPDRLPEQSRFACPGPPRSHQVYIRFAGLDELLQLIRNQASAARKEASVVAFFSALGALLTPSAHLWRLSVRTVPLPGLSALSLALLPR